VKGETRMVGDIRRIVVIFLCVGMLLPALSVLPMAVRNAEAAAPLQLIVGIPQTVDNLNPLIGYNNIDYQSYVLQFDFLYHFDKNFNPIPAAAESWSHSGDGKVWTFNIRHNMTFHDNVTVTAQDVNWTFNLMLNDPNAGALYVDLLKNITDIRALDDYTVRMTSNAPKANMLGLMIPILPRHLWSAIPANKLTSVDLWSSTYFPDGPIGSGPFRLVQYVTDSFIRYTTFPGYYGGTVHFDELLYKIYVNPQVMLNDLIAGTIDLACSPPKESWANTINKPGISGQVVPQLVLHEMGFNVCPQSLRVGGASTNLETLNKSVRMAVAMAIDKTAILENSYFGLGETGDVLVPPGSKTYHYNLTAAEEYKFNIVAAKALLNASGYIDTDSDGIRENSTSGAKLEFNYLYATEYPEDETAATRISIWLSQIGIRAIPQGELESQLFTDWIGMKYDMFMWNWGTDVDPTFILSVMTTGQIPTSHNDWSAWSDCFYSNPYYDQLFQQQQTTVDIPARQQIVYEMQRILYKDAPYVILAYPYGLYAYRNGSGDKFMNWPVMESDAVSPFSGTSGGPWFYFQILPRSEVNLPPADVSAGVDTIVALNETRSFTGAGYDPDNDTLTWTWKFSEPNGTSTTLNGQTVSYTFRNLGNVTVNLSVSDGWNPAVYSQIVVTVKLVPNAGWLVGYVRDTLEVPLVAAQVSASGHVATTNADGYYNMTLSNGTYDVTAVAQGFQTSTVNDVVVVKGQEKMQNFSLGAASSTLRGHVYDAETGKAILDVVVTVSIGSDVKTAVSNETGAYRILLVPAGTGNVSAAKTGYVTKTTSVQIVAGQEKVLDIELSPVAKGGKGLSSGAWMAIIVVIIVAVIAIAALLLMRRKKGAEPSPAPPQKEPKT